MSQMNGPDHTPGAIEQALHTLSRREFMKLTGASAALAILASCRNRMPAQFVLPYSEESKAVVGEARSFATTFPFAGFTQGLLVTSHEGRPTKIEGHPSHSASLGAAHVFAQSSLMDLYSPHRLRSPRRGGAAGTWEEFRSDWRGSQDGVAVLTQEIISPALARELALQSHFVYQTVPTTAAPVVDYAKALRVLAIDCDFLYSEPNAVANAQAWKSSSGKRLYVLEPTVSLTGTQADHRWALRNSDLQVALTQILAQIESPTSGHFSLGEKDDQKDDQKKRDPTAWQKVAEDLRAHAGRSVVVAGFSQDPFVHAQVHRLNELLGNLGRTVFTREAPPTRGLKELAAEIRRGRVGRLLILGGNPLFEAPGDLRLKETLAMVKLSAHLTLFPNETSAACRWQLPESHYLESWGDAISFDGTTSLIQPLLTPLYDSRSALELLADEDGHKVLRKIWAKLDERAWRQALQTGAVSKQSQFTSSKTPVLVATPSQMPASKVGPKLEIEFRPDPTIWDGAFSENPWLQELPKTGPQTAWDNAAWMSVSTASEYQLKNGDRLKIETHAGSLETAAWIVDGLPDHVVTLHLGYGRQNGGPVSEGAGFDAQKLRSSESPWRAAVTKLEKLEGHFQIACSQEHHTMDGRDLLRTVTPESVSSSKPDSKPKSKPDFAPGEIGLGLPTETIQTPRVYSASEQWAMTIDLASCIGCSACVIACQIENNVPAVGKKLMLQGRAMQWIRIDRYRPQVNGEARAERELANPLPVTCMHCETAPCELVCPVQATAHSSDGLNQMVYNRCVGTRYCSNNCPYKVRRFNFFDFTAATEPVLQLARNPEVTVRARGVMEKCTYCVQRIEKTRIQARREDRAIRDGEIVTACQATCPTQAITFGNLRDPKSAVNQKRQDSRTYGLLTELGTKPRTTYLARIANPNPELAL